MTCCQANNKSLLLTVTLKRFQEIVKLQQQHWKNIRDIFLLVYAEHVVAVRLRQQQHQQQ